MNQPKPDDKAFVLVMEPQPLIEIDTVDPESILRWCRWNKVSPPFSVGERMPIREEWRWSKNCKQRDDGILYRIKYRDGKYGEWQLGTNGDGVCHEMLLTPEYPWKPPETLPILLVREWTQPIVSIEAKQVMKTGLDFCPCCDRNDESVQCECTNTHWVWYFTFKATA